MVRREPTRTIRSSWREVALAAVLVLAATWVGSRLAGADGAGEGRPVHSVAIAAGPGRCDRGGLSNLTIRLTTASDAGLVVPPARFVVRWTDPGEPIDLDCAEVSGKGDPEVETTPMATTSEGRGVLVSITGASRGTKSRLGVGLARPRDSTVTTLRAMIEPAPGDDGSTRISDTPAVVAVSDRDPAEVAAQLVGPPEAAPLGVAGRLELSLRVTDGPAENVAAHIPLAEGLTVEGLHATGGGDCAPAPAAVTCRWPSMTETAAAVVDVVIAPEEDTCALLVLCVDAQVTWRTPDGIRETTARTEIDLKAPPGLVISSFVSDSTRVYAVSNTSTGRVTDVSVTDSACGPVVADGPTTVERGATLVFRCRGNGPGTREVTASGTGPDGASVSGRVVVD